MVEHNTKYGMNVEVGLPYEQAVARVREALAGEGFGVLTEIDVQATLKTKLDVDFRPCVNPGRLQPAPRPQGVQRGDGHWPAAALQRDRLRHRRPATLRGRRDRPRHALALTGHDALKPLAEEVQGRLVRVLEAAAAA